MKICPVCSQTFGATDTRCPTDGVALVVLETHGGLSADLSGTVIDGRYRVEGGDFITGVEVSWNESWNGTEQRRHYRVEGDKLFVETAPAPSITSPGQTDFRRIVFERDK